MTDSTAHDVATACALLAIGAAIMRNGSTESLDSVVYAVMFWACAAATLVVLAT